MCGIVGVSSQNQDDICLASLTRMTNAVTSRGPDDSGHWIDREAGIALGHRRLSIIDTSEAGHQPMRSHSGRYWLVLNGEIYNHLELRQNLERERRAPAWKGHSDTETFLAGVDAWGLECTLRRSVGMFALALWDADSRRLLIARDRIGEKPLYYGRQFNTFFFASDLAAIRAHPSFVPEVDRGSVALMMRHNYIPAPHSIYRGIRKLLPGTVFTLSHDSMDAQPAPYWSAAEAVTTGLSNPFVGTPREAVNKLDELLRSAVANQMVADVPLGAFLSGGIDSSTVVALMQAQSLEPIKTFSIGFHEASYDEAPHAKAVAQHLGTDHTEWYVTQSDALNVIPDLPRIYSEPFSDSSQIPTCLVSKLARRSVTVSLSGDGGDELFAGYPRYSQMNSYWQKVARIPLPVRQWMAKASDHFNGPALTGSARTISSLLPERHARRNLGALVKKATTVLTSDDLNYAYQRMVSHWAPPTDIVLTDTEPLTALTSHAARFDGHPIQQMMALDLVSYLPDDILCKVDRAAMAVSLETRVPLLDHRVVEFAWTIPLSVSVRDGATKWPLREVLRRYVPSALTDRPKMGFGVPIDQWLRGSLREWAEDLLSERRLRTEGFFRAGPIREKWHEHVTGKANWQYHLWDVLMFQAWHSVNC